MRTPSYTFANSVHATRTRASCVRPPAVEQTCSTVCGGAGTGDQASARNDSAITRAMRNDFIEKKMTEGVEMRMGSHCLFLSCKNRQHLPMCVSEDGVTVVVVSVALPIKTI